MDVRSVSPVPDRAGRVPDPQDPGPHRVFRCYISGALGMENLALSWHTGSPTSHWKGVQGFLQLSVLQGSPGPPARCCRGV